MISSAQKITKNVTAVQSKTAGAAFFRKAGEKSFFEASENHSFFGKHVQAKLTVSQPDDPKEKEADLVADKVMRMSEPTIVMAAAPLKDDKIEGKEDKELQREHGPHTINKIQCKEDKEDKVYTKNTLTVYRKHESDIDVKMQTAVIAKAGQSIDRKNTSLHPSEVIQCSGRGPPETAISFQQNLAASKGGGNPLPDNTRNFMENRFSADFSNIRVHNNSGAQQMSTQIQAHAFTHANDIYFNNGKYSPDTSGGKTLLAHELTHTIQQGASPQISKVAAKKENNIAASDAFTIYRKLNNLAAKYTPVTNIIHTSPASISSAGFSLTSEAKEYFEDSLKADVSDIRIHSNVESALLCRSRGVPAFVEGRNIIFDPSRYSPDSEDGGILLANKIAESLKQRSINVPGLAGQLSQGINQVKTGGSRSAVKKTESNKKDLHVSKDKKKPPLKGKGRKNASGNGSVKKGKGKRKKSDVFSGKTPKPNTKKSPASPEEDPAFYKVVKSAHARSEGQKKHDDPVTKARDAQQAAKAVANEAQSAAKKRKTDGMEEVANEDKPFDTESFKEDLLKKIEEVTPKQLEDVTEFKENNKIDNVKTAMGQKVVAEKDKTAGPVEHVNQQPLQVNEADNKKPVALPPTPKGNVPESIGAKDAAPKPKLDAEISMDKQSQQPDTEMKANNVTEDQLAKSNEPSFTNALKEKNNAQKDAKEKPLLFRNNEAQGLKSAQAASNADASKSMLSMFSTRGKNFDGAVKQQQTSKEKDEQERAAVVVKIQSIYQLTEATVTLLLTSAETVANSIFDTGNEKARKDFENYVDSEMRAYKQRRYSGFWGGLRWGKDKLFGMPKGVNKFYTVGRQRYLDQMEIIITQVAQVITTNLNAAKQTIKTGKKQIAEYVSTLQGSLKNVGKEAAENIQDKFDSLEQSVNDKREQLVDGLAKKYVDNLKKLDDRITELKDANKGLIDKAIGLLKEVWKVIKNLVQLFKTILSRIASVIELIIDDPGKFFDNLGAAFSQGFDRFKNRIGEHLENGLMAWLSAQIGVANIILPDKFDVSAIFGLVLQVLGLSYENIKERAVILIGEERVALLEQTAETGADIFQRIRRGGLGAVWEMIKEKLTDFKDMIWEAIKTFIKESVVKAAITFILSLLNPVAAFVKACMAIYQFIMMLVRMKDRIIDLLNSIMDAVAMIAAGSVDKAAAAVEMAFAKSIPIIIGFFAALLGLNDIGAKVRNIMLRIKEKINKVIDWILTKAYSIVKPVIEAAMRIKNKGKQLYEKGKEKAKALIEKGKEKVRGAIGGGGTPEEKLQNGLDDAQNAVNKYAGKRVGAMVLKPLLSIIKLKYGFQSLEIVARGSHWAVSGKVNPEGELVTEAQIEGKGTLDWLGIKEKFNTKDGKLHSIYFKGSGANAEIMVASQEENLKAFFNKKQPIINNITNAREKDIKRKALNAAKTAYDKAISLKSKINVLDSKKDKSEAEEKKAKTLIINLPNSFIIVGENLKILGVEDDPLQTFTTKISPASGGGKTEVIIADPLTPIPGNTAGSEAKRGAGGTFVPGWDHLIKVNNEAGNALKGKVFNDWQRMHLIHEYMHGPAEAFNLVPANNKPNTTAYTAVESKVLKKLQDPNAVLWYQTLVSYRTNEPNKNYLTNFPDNIRISWAEYTIEEGTNKLIKGAINNTGPYQVEEPPTLLGTGKAADPKIYLRNLDSRRIIIYYGAHGISNDTARRIVSAFSNSSAATLQGKITDYYTANNLVEYIDKNINNVNSLKGVKIITETGDEKETDIN